MQSRHLLYVFSRRRFTMWFHLLTKEKLKCDLALLLMRNDFAFPSDIETFSAYHSRHYHVHAPTHDAVWNSELKATGKNRYRNRAKML